MNMLLAVSDTGWAFFGNCLKTAEVVALAYIAYKQAIAHTLQEKGIVLQEQNRDALDGHLAKMEARQEAASLVRSDLSYTQGQEAGPGVAQASRSTPIERPRDPLDTRLGPDPLFRPDRDSH